MSKDNFIHLRVTDEEYEVISANAKSLKMPVSTYIRMVALGPVFERIDYEDIVEHTKTLTKLIDNMDSVAIEMIQRKDFNTRQINTVVYLMNRVYESEYELLEGTIERLNNLRKQLKKDKRKKKKRLS